MDANKVTEVDAEDTFLTADQIMSSSDIDVLVVPVKEWGGKVCFLAMTGEEAIQFYKDFRDPEKKDASIIRLFTLSAVNNPVQRKRIFTEAKVEALKQKKFGVFLRLQDKLLVFNGMKAEASTTKND